MAGYVDGFVMPLPKSNVDRYREVASTAGGLWIEHGALDYKECLADDVEVGEVTSFPRSVASDEDDETVIFAWITYASARAQGRGQRQSHEGRADEGADRSGRRDC